MLHDLRYAARILWKTKGLTAVAVVSLAIGIGSNAAIFSLVDAVLFRPRAIARPEEIVELYVGDRRSPYETTSYPSYLDLRERNDVFTGLAAYGVGWQFRLSGADDVEQVWGEVVSGNYFDVLGVRPHLGRTFLPEEDEVPRRNPVAVIGFRLWERRFAADPAIIGSTITINSQPLTVVGIAPSEYRGMTGGWASEIWVPAMTLPLLEPSRGDQSVTSRGNRWLIMAGRLRPGTSIDQARDRFEGLTRQMQAEHPEEWRESDGAVRELFVSLFPERETRVHPRMRAPVYGLTALLFGIVDLVLVMACMNLASMFFARAVARRGEIAVRLALGASRSRIVRQLLTESVLLALIAGAAGAIVGIGGLSLLMAYMPALPEGIRVAVDVRLDWRVVAYTILFAIGTGLLFGLAPALQASRAGMSAVLKDDSTVTAKHRRSRARSALVVGQVALSLLLLIGAGLVLRSLERVRPTRLGFASSNYLVAPLALNGSGYDRRTVQQFYERLSEEVSALPDVRAVSFLNGNPGGLMSRTRRSTGIEGYAPRDGESMEIDVSIVGPRHFTNMRVPIIAGRDFDQRDREGAPCVAIINEAFAEQYLGGSPAALGRNLIPESGRGANSRTCEIVGIVRDDEWQSLNGEVRPFHVWPLLQSDVRRMALIVETSTSPASLKPALRQVIRRLDPEIPLTDLRTLDEFFDSSLYPFRLFGFLMVGCGTMALLLAIVGIYGTISYSVAQRSREVGIRMALGAVHGDILKLMVGQGMLLVSYGLGVGLLLSAAFTGALTRLELDAQLLFGVSATDSLTFLGVTLLLALVALAACWIPARRAARLDPMVTLRGT